MPGKFLETVDDPAIPELLRHIDRLRSAQSGAPTTAAFDDAAPYLDKEQYSEVLRQVCALQEVLFSQTEKEAEESLYVVCSLIQKAAADGASAARLAEQFANAITQNGTVYPLLRLKILCNVFNLLEGNNEALYCVFSAVVKYSAATKNVNLIVPHLSNVEGWMDKWQTDIAKRRSLFLTIFESLNQGGKKAQAHSFLQKYLSTFQGASKAELDAASEHAVQAVVESINGPDIYQFEFYLELDAVTHLQTGKHANLFKLLNIFARDNLAAFLEFEKANAGYIAQLGLDREECVRKMRLLSLCSLASGEAEVPYSTIAECMRLEEDQVERWVIKAISAKLIDSKMDQLKRTAVIKGSMNRVFTEVEWKQLHGNLDMWRSNVTSLLQMVRDARLGPSTES